MSATPPAEQGSGVPTGTLVVIALAVFALLFVVASFVDPSAITGGGSEAPAATP